MMGRCSYCGQPAGFLRTQHPECSARYHRAMSMMPTFFAKFLESQVPAERFSELLRGAAQAAFVRPEALAALAVAEIGRTIDTLRAQRPPSLSEIQRFSELMDQLGPSVAEDAGLNERLAKATVIAELQDGRIPDAVTVAGPLPIRLARGENVLWIFNRVEAYRAPPQTQREDGMNPLADAAGHNPATLTDAPPPAAGSEDRSAGDVVVTDRNIHLLLNGGTHERITIGRVSSVRTYANGIHVIGASADVPSWVFLLDDPSFAANVISRLRQVASG